eukprot:200873-Hanusia_phi.AAC.1
MIRRAARRPTGPPDDRTVEAAGSDHWVLRTEARRSEAPPEAQRAARGRARRAAARIGSDDRISRRRITLAVPGSEADRIRAKRPGRAPPRVPGVPYGTSTSTVRSLQLRHSASELSSPLQEFTE